LIRQRNGIVTAVIALGIPCIAAIWLYEALAGLLTPLAQYYYPFLILVLAASLVAIRTAPHYRLSVECFAFGCLASYFVCSLGSFALYPAHLTMYNVANTIQWMPILYVTAFIFLSRKQAISATTIVFFLSLVPTAFVLCCRPGAWSGAIMALVFNAYAVHLVTILALSLVIVMSRQYDRSREEASALAAEARLDPLTGALNRRGFHHLFYEAVDAGVDAAGLIMLDLDGFKHVNDAHGHLVGDEVITLVAKIVRTELRSSDLLCRWGGEEFLLAILAPTDGAALLIANRTRAAIAASPHRVTGVITASLGVSEWSRRMSLQEAIQRADEALYQAKLAGRNRVQLAAV
jgi:diguanylate cyclase (GGDEF)-like protein